MGDNRQPSLLNPSSPPPVPVQQYPPANVGPGSYYQSPPPNYQPPPPNYQPPPPNYQAPPQNYQALPQNYQPPPQNYQPVNVVEFREERIVVAQPDPNYAVYIPADLGFSSQSLHCPQCQQMIITRTSRSPSAAAWASCVILLIIFLIFWLPLCCIPFCLPTCYDVKHYCPVCGVFLGQRTR